MHRGSARRGIAFESAIKWNMGKIELEDQVRAVQYFSRHNCRSNKNKLSDGRSSGSDASFIDGNNKYNNCNINNSGKKRNNFGLVNLKKVQLKKFVLHYSLTLIFFNPLCTSFLSLYFFTYLFTFDTKLPFFDFYAHHAREAFPVLLFDN